MNSINFNKMITDFLCWIIFILQEYNTVKFRYYNANNLKHEAWTTRTENVYSAKPTLQVCLFLVLKAPCLRVWLLFKSWRARLSIKGHRAETAGEGDVTSSHGLRENSYMNKQLMIKWNYSVGCVSIQRASDVWPLRRARL